MSWVGPDEKRDTYACLLQTLDDRLEEVTTIIHRPATIGGERIRLVRHERHLLRAYRADEVEERVRRVALDVELCGDHLPEVSHILISDVSLVRSRVYRDPLSTKLLTAACCQYYIRRVSATSVAEGRYLVDVNA